jgi:hypothetical protein
MYHDNKFVIFKHFKIYAITSKANWDEYLMNNDKIIRLNDVKSYKEAEELVINQLGISKEQIINKTGENE